MARLTPAEFENLVGELVGHYGAGGLRNRLQRTNTLVSRKGLGNPAALARHLYPLTGGLERQGHASQVLLALWEETVGSRLEEGDAEKLEALAERINACLEGEDILPERQTELREALDEYRRLLEERVGEAAARIAMITRAVGPVADIVRGV